MNSNWSYSPETKIWVVTSVTLTFDLWPWPFAWTLPWSNVITPENFMMIRWWEHSQKGVTDGQTDRRTALDVLVYILLSVGLWAARCRERARDDHLRRSAFWQTCLCGVHENSVMSELQPTLLMTVNVLVYICYLYAMGCKLYRACMWLPLRCSSSWQTSLCCVSEFEYWLR